MAYGQTGTGKTYTMSSVTDQSVTEIFRHIHAVLCPSQPSPVYRTTWLAQAPDREFLLRMSFVEVYNEVSINNTSQLSLTACSIPGVI